MEGSTIVTEKSIDKNIDAVTAVLIDLSLTETTRDAALEPIAATEEIKRQPSPESVPGDPLADGEQAESDALEKTKKTRDMTVDQSIRSEAADRFYYRLITASDTNGKQPTCANDIQPKDVIRKGMSVWLVSSVNEAAQKFQARRAKDDKGPVDVYGGVRFSEKDLCDAGFEIKQEDEPDHYNCYFKEEENKNAIEYIKSAEGMYQKAKGEKLLTTVAKVLFDKCKKAGKVVLSNKTD